MPRKSDPNRPAHPGRTSAERRALDAIGVGEVPHCSPKTIKNLLDAGLIVKSGAHVRGDALGTYSVPFYSMPIPVHILWCAAVAATDEEMAEFEAEMAASQEAR